MPLSPRFRRAHRTPVTNRNPDLAGDATLLGIGIGGLLILSNAIGTALQSLLGLLGGGGGPGGFNHFPGLPGALGQGVGKTLGQGVNSLTGGLGTAAGSAINAFGTTTGTFTFVPPSTYAGNYSAIVSLHPVFPGLIQKWQGGQAFVFGPGGILGTGIPGYNPTSWADFEQWVSQQYGWDPGSIPMGGGWT